MTRPSPPLLSVLTDRFCMDIKEILITAVFGLVTAIIIRFWEYMWTPFKVDDDMVQLRNKRDNLKAKFNDLQVQISKAELEGKTCTHVVDEWMKQVESIKSDVLRIHLAYSGWRSNYKGLYSSLIFWERIGISYQVFKKLKEVTELRDPEGAFKEVATKLPPPAAQEMPSTPRVHAMDSNRDQIIHHLLNNDEVEIIGIWGMGGVGKTTLLKIINNYFAHHKGLALFDRVIFVVASKNVSLEDLQQKILKKLGLTSVGSGDVDSGATKLFNFINRNKVLLLLDDMWEHVELHRLGVLVGRHKCKVVFTTRSVDVCDSMKANEKLKVECLKKDDAWSLFKANVGESINIESDLNIGPLARKLFKECQGLPLALITIGRAMSTRKTWKAWQHALSSLQSSKPKEILDIGNKMFPILEFSYQNLQNETMRECFLSCSLWPEDYIISRDDLIRCWMGLELIDDYSEISEAYDKGDTIIERLLGACLLDDYNDYNEINEEYDDELYNCVKMHDVIRDLALWIASGHGQDNKKWMVISNEGKRKRKKEEWDSAERISIFWEFVMPEHLVECRKLLFLMLHVNYSFTRAPAIFQCLTALTYLDLRCSSLKTLPVEIGKLVHLKFLNLECTQIDCLPDEFSNLVNLKYLFMRGTKINPIPWGLISQLPMLKMLDLFNCSGDLGQDGLEVLEKQCGNLMGLGINVATISVLDRLSMLYSISIVNLCIRNLGDMESLELLAPGGLKILRIDSCETLQMLIVNSIHIGGVIRERSLPRLEELYLSDLPLLKKIEWSGVTAKESLPSLTLLFIHGCDKLKNVSWVSELPNLVSLSLDGCNELEIVIDNGDDCSGDGLKELVSMFPRLRSLTLYYLPNLGRICNTMNIAFPSLRKLDVYNCPMLKKLPFQASNIPNKLRGIYALWGRSWWEQLEWEDDNTEALLKEFLFQ